MRATGIRTRWVNNGRQLAGVLTKPTAPSASTQQLQRSGKWKIVWDADFTSAKNLRKAKREQHFKDQPSESVDPFAQGHINLVEEMSISTVCQERAMSEVSFSEPEQILSSGTEPELEPLAPHPAPLVQTG